MSWRQKWFADPWAATLRMLLFVLALVPRLLSRNVLGLIVVGVLFVLSAIPWWAMSPALNIVLLACAAVSLWYHQQRFKRPSAFSDELRSTAPGRPVAIDTSILDIAESEDYVDDHYELGAIEYFVNTLIQLPNYLSRVDETMEVDGRRATLRTELLFRGLSEGANGATPAATGAVDNGRISSLRDHSDTIKKDSESTSRTVLVPLLSAKKGLLFDGFSAFDSSNGAVPTLPPVNGARPDSGRPTHTF